MGDRIIAWLCSDRGWHIVGCVVVGLAAICATCCLAYSIPKPLLGPHNFRQTQNAISSYYSVKEHASVFSNVMPVLGRPWNLPTEFPLYQYITGCLHWLSGLPLDACGRLVSAVCWVACIIACIPLLRMLGVQSHDLWIPVALLLSCPAYLFWGATFMMETMALLLSLGSLYALLRCNAIVQYANHRTGTGAIYRDKAFWWWWTAGVNIGTLAALQKASTWIIAMFVGFLFAAEAARHLRPWRFIARSAWLLPLVVVPYVIACNWFEYGDGLKRQNPFARDMFVFSNPEFREWNYGTAQQKANAATWKMIAGHMQEGMLVSIPPVGDLAIPGVFLACVLLSAKRRAAVGLLLLGFFVGPAVFTNVYYVHNYYMCATGVWLLLALGLAIVGVAEMDPRRSWHRLVALVITVSVTTAGFSAWNSRFLPILRSFPTHAQLRAAWTDPVQRIIPYPRTLLVLGDDWNPIALYYAERKGIAWPDKMLEEFPGRRMAEAQSLLAADESLGGVVVNQRLLSRVKEGTIARILADLKMSQQGIATPFGVLFPALDLQDRELSRVRHR